MATHPSLLSSLAHLLLHLSPSRSLVGGASENSKQSKNSIEGEHREGEESDCEQREVAVVWQRRLLRETVRAMSTAASSTAAAACAIARSHPDVILGLCHAACSSTPCMYAHTYVYVHTYIRYVCMYIRACVPPPCMYVHTYVYVHTYIRHVCMYIRTYVPPPRHICMDIRVYAYVCMRVRVCVYVCVISV